VARQNAPHKQATEKALATSEAKQRDVVLPVADFLPEKYNQENEPPLFVYVRGH
jgi:predicted Rossmann fold nucleotide-binding protein DprA/Smf involved in DNA uptake